MRILIHPDGTIEITDEEKRQTPWPTPQIPWDPYPYPEVPEIGEPYDWRKDTFPGTGIKKTTPWIAICRDPMDAIRNRVIF